MSKIYTDILDMTDIRNHMPGLSVLNKLYEVQNVSDELSGVQKFFGVNPLTEDARSWYSGLLGEQRVGALLDALKNDGYLVLHSVPIGVKGSDIDHIIFSPTGAIYTINTKRHPGKKIWVGKVLLINGTKTDHIRNSVFEAERVSKMFPGEKVTAMIAVVDAANIVDKGQSTVIVSDLYKTISFIKNEEKKRTKIGLKLVADFGPIIFSDFWSTAYEDLLTTQPELWVWFNKLKSQVNKQNVKRKMFGLFFVGILVITGLTIFSHIL